MLSRNRIRSSQAIKVNCPEGSPICSGRSRFLRRPVDTWTVKNRVATYKRPEAPQNRPLGFAPDFVRSCSAPDRINTALMISRRMQHGLQHRPQRYDGKTRFSVQMEVIDWKRLGARSHREAPAEHHDQTVHDFSVIDSTPTSLASTTPFMDPTGYCPTCLLFIIYPVLERVG